MIHVVEKIALIFVIEQRQVGVINIAAERQATPRSRDRGIGRHGGILTDAGVVIRREVNTLLRRSQNLQRTAALIDRCRRTADTNFRVPQFQNRAGVNHHRHSFRHFHRGSRPAGLVPTS